MIDLKVKNLVLVIGLVMVAFVAGVVASPHVRHGVSYYEANVYVSENVGGVEAQLLGANVITDIGEEYIRDWLGCGSGNTTSRNGSIWVTVSNDVSPVQTWTELANEATASGCGRVLGNITWWAAADDGFNVTAEFEVSGDITLQCAGLQWSGVAESNNNLFACAAFTQTTFASGDSLTVTWVVTVNAN